MTNRQSGISGGPAAPLIRPADRNHSTNVPDRYRSPPRQIGWVTAVKEWALIRRLVAYGVPQRQVARESGVGRSTVARALASDRPPKYERPAVATSFTPFESLVQQLLPDTSATGDRGTGPGARGRSRGSATVSVGGVLSIGRSTHETG